MWKKTEKFSDEEICLKVITYVVSNEELLTQFIISSGISPDELKTSLESEETIGYIFDFLLQDEEAFTAFCATHNISPENVWKIRRQLPGAPVFWN